MNLTSSEELISCLGFWFPEGKGVPWCRASHILASVLLAPVDTALIENGITHLRLVDDFRIFCHSESECHRALQLLEQHLQTKKLKLKVSKTQTTRINLSHFQNPIKDYIHKLGATGMMRFLGSLETRFGTSPSRPLRAFAYSYLRQLYRPYLAWLTTGLNQTQTILDLLQGRIPSAYVHALCEGSQSNDCTDLWDVLAKALECAETRALARYICLQLESLPPHTDPPELFDPSPDDRLENLLFLALFPSEVVRSHLQKCEPTTMLEQCAVSELLTLNA